MSIPEEIKRIRLKGLSNAIEVMLISWPYFVYEISSKLDERNVGQKTTGKCYSCSTRTRI